MSEQDTVTLPETTIVGEPGSSGDPLSGDDAYADGYAAGLRGAQSDDSGYEETAQGRYRQGYSVGAAEAQLSAPTEPDGAGQAEEVGEEIAHLLAPEVLAHALEIAPWPTLVALALSPGGDTSLRPAEVFLALCHRSDHGLSGDAILDGGAWHGTATLSYDDATAEGAEHASTWDHTDGSVHTWSRHGDQWAQMSTG